ncbi:hypothetical protein QUB70_12905 [Microcoleus sp. A003_D6]|uniref:hypothetical protein n=1 Tax=Microcoleus sp. A003_D6 TaxID=3055266 RepID=UPI002FD5A7D6
MAKILSGDRISVAQVQKLARNASFFLRKIKSGGIGININRNHDKALPCPYN